MRQRRSRKAVAYRPGRLRYLGQGAFGLAVLIGLLVFGINAPNGIPGRSYYEIDVAFEDADNIAAHAQVRMGGRIVGQVLRPRVEDGEAVATLQLSSDLEPLRASTRVMVKPRSAIGVRFVELFPGAAGPPLAAGQRIPASQTGATRPLDEALGTLDARTRDQTRRFLRELGTGMAGRGEDLHDTIEGATPMLHDLRRVMGAVPPGAGGAMVRGADTLLSAADPVRDALADGFPAEAAAMRVVRDAREELHATLEAAPEALPATAAGLARTRPLVRAVDRFARESLPLLRAAPATLRHASLLLREGGPTVRAARTTLRDARAALPPTLDLLDRIQPELEPLEATMDAATPLLRELAPRHCDLRNMLGGWASMTSLGNAAGNYLRFNVPVSAESVQALNGINDIGPLRIHDNPYPAPCEAGTEKVGR